MSQQQPSAQQLPYFLTNVPGVGGRIKQRASDFFVQEIPAYEPEGEGEHLYVEIQKVGLTTFDAINKIAERLNISTRDIGYAGLKDANAVTRQTLSIWGATEQAVMALNIPNLTVQWAARHVNKLRLGHLAGNRFAIKIRDVDPHAVVRVADAMKILQTRGVPNYFGTQRFGRRGDNDALGEALLHGNHAGVLKHLLGMPIKGTDDPEVFRARTAYENRDNALAMKIWPRRYGLERRVLARLVKTNKPAAAVKAIDERLRRLWVSSLQSRIFNDVLSRRLESIDKLEQGDLAYKHDNGACFLVEDPGKEQPRAEAFEISPTGPLLGYRTSMPQGHPLEIEQQVFKEHKVTADTFANAGRVSMKGARRPLRIQPKDVQVEGGVDEHGPHITVAFTLPAGSFATVVLREIMKNDHGEADEEFRAEAETEDAPKSITYTIESDSDADTSDVDAEKSGRAPHPLFGHNAPDLDDDDDD